MTDDLLEVMKRNQRPVNRAIMAQTLGKLPTFFKNANEVMDYVQHSLGQCSDEAELISCIKLLEAQRIG